MKIIPKILFIVFLMLNISLYAQNNKYGLRQRGMKKHMLKTGKQHLMYNNLEKKIFKDLKAKYPKIALYLKENPRSKAKMRTMQQFFKKSGRLLLQGKEEESYNHLLTMLKLNIEIEMNVKKYYTVSDIEKKDIEQILKQKISLLFDLREKMRHKIIEGLENKLKDEKKKYDLRQKNKSKIIDKRLEQFIGKKDVLGW